MTPRVRRYVEEACQRFDATPETVMSPSHHRGDVLARREVMYRLRQDGFSLPQIGRWMGRDHSTVVLALRKVQQAIDSAREFA